MVFGINFKKLSTNFKFAFEGIKLVFKEEQPFRIMFLIAVLVIIAMFYFNLPLIQKVVLFSVITLVLTLELVNSVVEQFLDFVHPARDGKIKRIKDMLAAIVLIASIGAAVIGIMIFSPFLKI